MDEKKPDRITYQELTEGTVGQTVKGKRLLDPDVVKRMKKAKMPKPADVSKASWEQVQEVVPGKHTLVAHLAACGLKVHEIAEASGLCDATVKRYLQSEKIKFEIKMLQHKYFGADPAKRFRSMIRDATDVIEEQMKDPQVKPSVRVLAADKILDRALGRPKQFLQVEGSLIRKIFETLDGNKPVLDVDSIPEAVSRELPAPVNTVEKVDRSDNPNLQETPQKDWGDWLDKNI